MSPSVYEDLEIFAVCFLLGVILIAVYDVIRIFRRVVPHNLLWITLEDFGYWIGLTVIVFFVLHRENYGKWDYIVILAAFLGMISYHYGIGKWMVEPVARVLRRILLWLKKWKNRLTEPLKKFMMLLCKQIRKFARKRKDFHEEERDCISQEEKE